MVSRPALRSKAFARHIVSGPAAALRPAHSGPSDSARRCAQHPAQLGCEAHPAAAAAAAARLQGAMSGKWNQRNPAVKRIVQELKEIQRDDDPDILAEAIEVRCGLERRSSVTATSLDHAPTS